MSDKTTGMGAEVGVRKIENGNVTETRGSASPPRWSYWVFYVLSFLSLFGLWKISEIILALV